MSHDQRHNNTPLPAPCIVDQGIVVNKQDMQRLLNGLGRVRYVYIQADQSLSDNEGFVVEVFADPGQATIVTNHALYLNVHSFDYLELKLLPDHEACLDLVQDNRRLRLLPLSNPLQEQSTRILALEAMVAEVLSASWDLSDADDEENFSM
jgi:hypothetical protein